jgi:hypothetical protein
VGQFPQVHPLEQPQHLDELPRPRPAELGLQPPPQDAEVDLRSVERQKLRSVDGRVKRGVEALTTKG